MSHHNTHRVRNAETTQSAEQLIGQRTGEKVVNNIVTPKGDVIVVTDPEPVNPTHNPETLDPKSVIEAVKEHGISAFRAKGANYGNDN